jgi:uncharacterized protein (DUF488 family)
MKERTALDKIDIDFFTEKKSCLLCSERTPEECHRRLVAEMMKEKWTDLEIVHLIDLNKRL